MIFQGPESIHRPTLPSDHQTIGVSFVSSPHDNDTWHIVAAAVCVVISFV